MTGMSAPSAEPARAGRLMMPLALLAALFVSLFVVTEQGLGRFERRRLVEVASEQIEAISALRLRAIASWRGERLGDALALASPRLADSFHAWLSTQDPAERTRLEQALESVVEAFGYSSVTILDEIGAVRLAVRRERSADDEIPGDLVAEAMIGGGPRIHDLRRTTGGHRLFVSAPLAASDGAQVGRLLLALDPSRSLDPLLEKIPGTAGAVESFLVRREGDQVLYLTPVSGDPDATLALRRPLDTSDLPAAAALRKRRGLIEGRDRVGREVVAFAAPVAGSPWTLVTQIARTSLARSLVASAVRVATAASIAFLATMFCLLLLERRRRIVSERALSDSEGRYQAIFDQAVDAIYLMDRDGRCLDANRSGLALLGYDLPELRRRRISELVDPEDLSREPISWSTLKEGRSIRRERRLLHRDGSRVPVELVTTPLADGRRLSVVRDIRERKSTEARLELLSRALERSPAATLITDADGVIEYVNPRFSEVTGWSADDAVGKTPRILKSGRTPPAIYASMWAAMTAGREWHGTLLNARRDGELFWWSLAISPIGDESGRTRAYVAIGEDVTQRREERERWRQSQRLARLADWSYDVASGRLWLSEEAVRLLELGPETATPSLADLFAPLHPEDLPAAREAFDRAVSEGIGYQVSFRVPASGRGGEGGGQTGERLVSSGVEVETDSAGRPLRLIGVLQDLTELERSRQQLESAREELAQAQKMDAIGRLAGGIAHDFNNLLGIVLGYAELLGQEAEISANAREYTGEIIGAVHRGADLARQMLTMGRRSPARLRPTDVAALLADTARMLRRVLPANLQLSFSAAADLWQVEADPGQLTQVLVNLALNARDATTDGGSIRIEAVNDEIDARRARRLGAFDAGHYVRIEVLDDGSGIAPEILPRVFEPFFTTKEEGKGTGLGLPTVYGIVRQGGGRIRVKSDAGQGTRVSVWLPRFNRGDRPDSGAIEPVLEAASTDAVTVLLVEDQPELLASIERMLRSFGYAVVSAGSAEEGARRFREHPEISLLLSDVVLPDRNGKKLAFELRALRPDLAVVLMSGYSAISETEFRELVDAGYAFLQKPFGIQELQRTLRSRHR